MHCAQFLYSLLNNVILRERGIIKRTRLSLEPLVHDSLLSFTLFKYSMNKKFIQLALSQIIWDALTHYTRLSCSSKPRWLQPQQDSTDVLTPHLVLLQSSVHTATQTPYAQCSSTPVQAYMPQPEPIDFSFNVIAATLSFN